MFGLVKSVIPFGIATPNQLGTTGASSWKSILVRWTFLFKKRRSPGGGTDVGSMTNFAL
jgi:hypothetical protein